MGAPPTLQKAGLLRRDLTFSAQDKLGMGLWVSDIVVAEWSACRHPARLAQVLEMGNYRSIPCKALGFLSWGLRRQRAPSGSGGWGSR